MSRSRRNTRRRRSGLAPRRLGVLAAASLCGFALLGVRAAQLGAIDSSRLAQIAAGQTEATLRIQPQRARIVDRQGNLLASSAEVESVAAAPRELQAALAAPLLARALNMKTRDVYRRLDSRGRFVWIKRWVEPSEAAKVRALDLEGVTLQTERRRFYPNGEMAAAYIGVAGRDGRGLTGLEFFHDAALRGEAAAIPARRDGSGRKLPSLGGSPAGEAGLPARLAASRAPVSPLLSGAGKPLRLSLDAKLQHSADKALQRATARTKARRATLIAMNPHSGDVLAIAHSPTFNPNRFWDEDPARFRVNAFVDTFEPGSTLKPFSIAIALESGAVKPGDAFDCEQGAWRVRNRTIHDMKPHDVLTVHDILRVSSNIGAGKIANRVGSQNLVAGLASFGFGERTGHSFPGEASGLLHDLRKNQDVERANLAFGQGISVTAIQLATAGSILANGGRRVAPRLVLDGSEPAPGERVISARTSRAVLSMLRDAVASGTGRMASLPDHSVAGKTGTAQKVVDGTYSSERHVASFLGIVPTLNPRLVVVVVLDEPQGVYGGGEVAAPVFREFAGYAVRQLGIPAGGAE